MMNESQPRPTPFVAQLERMYPLVEMVCVATFLITLFRQPSWRNDAITASLTALAAVFFLRAFSPPKKKPEETDIRTHVLLPKLLGIGSSVCLIGFLFYLLHLEGADQMLLIGTGTMAGCLVGSIIAAVKSSNVLETLLPLILRGAAVAALGVYGLYRLGLFN